MKKIIKLLLCLIIIQLLVKTTYDLYSFESNIIQQNKIDSTDKMIVGLGVFGYSFSLIELNLEYNIYKDINYSDSNEVNLFLGTGVSVGLLARSFPITANLTYGNENCLELGLALLFWQKRFYTNESGNSFSILGQDKLRLGTTIGYRFVNKKNNSIWRIHTGFHYLPSSKIFFPYILGVGYSFYL